MLQTATFLFYSTSLEKKLTVINLELDLLQSGNKSNS